MDEIEEIKRRIDIVDFISSYLNLKKAGSSYKSLCPFHQEKVPSFYVSPERQIFKCFGCGKAGDVIGFLMEIENLDFPEALKILAEKAGVKLKRFEKKEWEEEKELKTRLYEINKLAALFFHKILTEKPKAQFVRDYLKSRQINQKSIKEFMLGYAPDSYDLLSNFLIKRGYKMLDIHQAGLVVESEKKEGEYYDRFRNRLMFPIFDQIGNVIAFTGRAMEEVEGGKYINSPETAIYSKSKVLYGLDKAKRAIKEKNEAIIVEGQTDLIACHQRGFKNVVASSGTALTPFQLQILSRLTSNLAFAFDQDKAGEEATKRAVDLAHQYGFEVKIILTPSGKDPDECLRENPLLWEKALSQKRNIMDFFFETAFKNHPKILDSTSKREIAQELLPTIKNISDKIVQAHWLSKLAEGLKVPEKYLFEALEKIKERKEEKIEEAFQTKEADFEERLLSLVLTYPEFQKDFFQKVKPEDFEDEKLKGLALALKKYYNEVAIFNLRSFKRRFPQLVPLLDVLTFFKEPLEKEVAEKEYKEYLRRFKTQKMEKIKKFYEEEIKEAEKLKDREKVKALILEFQKKIIQG